MTRQDKPKQDKPKQDKNGPVAPDGEGRVRYSMKLRKGRDFNVQRPFFMAERIGEMTKTAKTAKTASIAKTTSIAKTASIAGTAAPTAAAGNGCGMGLPREVGVSVLEKVGTVPTY